MKRNAEFESQWKQIYGFISNKGQGAKMSSSFVLKFHFAFELFFGLKISSSFTYVHPYLSSLKKVKIKLETLTRVKCLMKVLTDVCLSVIFLMTDV